MLLYERDLWSFFRFEGSEKTKPIKANFKNFWPPDGLKIESFG